MAHQQVNSRYQCHTCRRWPLPRPPLAFPRSLLAHLRKAHQLTPKDYYRRYNLDPKKFPLVCKEYSEQRRKLAKEKGLGAKGFGRRKTS